MHHESFLSSASVHNIYLPVLRVCFNYKAVGRGGGKPDEPGLSSDPAGLRSVLADPA